MRRFIGQPKFSGDRYHQHIGYELFAREYDGGQWALPTDFNAITAVDIRRMLSEALLHMDHRQLRLVSFNLEQRQFIDPAYVEAVLSVQRRTPIRLMTELTERVDPDVTLEQLKAGAKRFYDAGLAVCIDDVGTDGNSDALVQALDPYVTEYKFAFQNLRPFNDLEEVAPYLKHWYDLAEHRQKQFAIEGIETPSGLQRLTNCYPADVYQGYLLGRPAVLPQAIG